jgi:leucyl aminopeptidase
MATPTVSVRGADLGADTPLLVVALAPDPAANPPAPALSPALASLDATLGGALGRALAARDFRGGRDETLYLSGGTSGPRRVLLVGLGKGAASGGRARALALRRAASIAARRANDLGVGDLAFVAGPSTAEDVEQIAIGLQLGPWAYADLKTPPPADERRAPLATAAILVDDAAPGLAAATAAAAAGDAIGAGYAIARRLGMMPGNVCTPDFLATTAREIAARHRLEVSVLGRTDLEALAMHSFLCVAQGTPQDPKLIVLSYRAAGVSDPPIALVGKGLCFDSGGISIKPAAGMEHMKFDMCGAAGVLGAMEAIARLALRVNVVGLIGATTNMPSGTAVKPGDVVTASSGKSIEVINTDAEGRLVLADVLTYAKRYAPSAIVDAATLTGAIVVALGERATGVFGTNQSLIDEILAAGERSGERGWSMPMWDDYKDLIKSDVADLKNTGGRSAGAITAAKFLEEFVEGIPWVHLDIAGTAYSETDLVVTPKGPTGVPVGMFVEFARARAR